MSSSAFDAATQKHLEHLRKRGVDRWGIGLPGDHGAPLRFQARDELGRLLPRGPRAPEASRPCGSALGPMQALVVAKLETKRWLGIDALQQRTGLAPNYLRVVLRSLIRRGAVETRAGSERYRRKPETEKSGE